MVACTGSARAVNGRPVYHAAASLPSRVREYRSHKARLELNGTPTPWRLEKSLPSAVSGEVAREMKLAGGMINTIEKYTLKSPRDVFLREQFAGTVAVSAWPVRTVDGLLGRVVEAFQCKRIMVRGQPVEERKVVPSVVEH